MPFEAFTIGFEVWRAETAVRRGMEEGLFGACLKSPLLAPEAQPDGSEDVKRLGSSTLPNPALSGAAESLWRTFSAQIFTRLIPDVLHLATFS